jgi:hypothetical protein
MEDILGIVAGMVGRDEVFSGTMQIVLTERRAHNLLDDPLVQVDAGSEPHRWAVPIQYR